MSACMRSTAGNLRFKRGVPVGMVGSAFRASWSDKGLSRKPEIPVFPEHRRIRSLRGQVIVRMSFRWQRLGNLGLPSFRFSSSSVSKASNISLYQNPGNFSATDSQPVSISLGEGGRIITSLGIKQASIPSSPFAVAILTSAVHPCSGSSGIPRDPRVVLHTHCRSSQVSHTFRSLRAVRAA